MVNIFLFLAVVFIATFLVGKLLEKAKIPWIFASVLVGVFLSIKNPFLDITSSEPFTFFATMGMYFLLFMIGFEINLKEIRKRTGFIFRATFFIIFFESFFGTLFIHYIFNSSWLISVIVAMSFATVGEAVLIPILDKFKIVNSKLGQLIIGVGTFDDLIEVSLIIFIGLLLGSDVGTGFTYTHILVVLFSLFGLFGLTALLVKIKKSGEQFSIHNIESLFLVVLAVLFLFLGIGDFAESSPLAAILAGVAVKTFVPKKRLELIEREIKAISYGFFAPLFFLWIGLSIDFKYLVNSPLLVFLLIGVTATSKIVASYLISHKFIGTKQSVLLGIGLSVRFSTSLVITKLLLDKGIIGNEVYSVIIASSILFVFIIPVLFSNLLVVWKIAKTKKNS